MGSGDMLPEDAASVARFSVLNTRRKALVALARAVEEKARGLRDAAEEVALAMDDDCLIQVGESYVSNFGEGKVEEILAERLTVAEQAERSRRGDLAKLEEEMEALKAALYAKFGQANINLEYR